MASSLWGRLVHERRAMLGLMRSRPATLTGLLQGALVGICQGALANLGADGVAYVLSVPGLNLDRHLPGAMARQRGLWIAAKNASMISGQEAPPARLGCAVVSGLEPKGWNACLTQ